MGQNLSLSEKFADTSAATLSPTDKVNIIIMACAWAGSIYGIGMIWCAVNLLQRWSGRHGEKGFNLFSILAAFILSSGWPLIMLYFAMSSR
ncbi:hypothetical protein QBC42DRAFT_278558 [Cladorrhinum samala]|uniref:Uncharacterized protein n=1 Tax=Cladorrhinum samala TaxID=585594 RepID=A0AAV9HD50_9PEZI|nr:hypothetical protein QBC42DRAFT_278558 [Cladorrhinum samala]